MIPLITLFSALTLMITGCSMTNEKPLSKSPSIKEATQYTVEATNKKVQNTLGTNKRERLLDQAILYNYWHRPNFEKTQKSGTTDKANFPALESLYKKAIAYDPTNTKYLMGYASVLRSQKKYAQARSVWDQILKIDPNNFYALLKKAAYTQYYENPDSFRSSLNKLESINKPATERIKSSLSTLKEAETMPLNHDFNQYKPTGKNRFIVLLGFVLNSKGEISPTLHQMLQTTLKLANSDPEAKIIVAGGQLPQEPKVEAKVMKNWLIKHGIKAKRIHAEGQSLDTLENALNSTAVLKKNKATNVTLVCQASHMRRAFTLFSIAEKQFFSPTDQPYKLTNFVSIDDTKALDPIDKQPERIKKVLTDVLRINGYWLLPDIQR